jgi:uncharacterized protein (TIGR00369 family)
MSDHAQSIKVSNPSYREEARRVFENAAFVADIGVRLVEIGPGWAETELEVLPRHYQHTGLVHMGVQATMADHTAGTAATTVLRAGEYVLSAQVSLNLLRPAAGELLRCRSTVIKPGRRLVIAESEVFAIDDGKSTLVSKATVTLVVLKVREGME